jgi:hypothetical protein
MGSHLIDGEFQSDKYPTCPRGKVPLSCKDPKAQPHLWDYAEDHRDVDAEFSDDVQAALRIAGYKPPGEAAELPAGEVTMFLCEVQYGLPNGQEWDFWRVYEVRGTLRRDTMVGDKSRGVLFFVSGSDEENRVKYGRLFMDGYPVDGWAFWTEAEAKKQTAINGLRAVTDPMDVAIDQLRNAKAKLVEERTGRVTVVRPPKE